MEQNDEEILEELEQLAVVMDAFSNRHKENVESLNDLEQRLINQTIPAESHLIVSHLTLLNHQMQLANTAKMIEISELIRRKGG